MSTTTQLDWTATEAKAKGMTLQGLWYASMDCLLAAEAADELEAAGCRVSKTGGYYMDESSVYTTEAKRRGDAPAAR